MKWDNLEFIISKKYTNIAGIQVIKGGTTLFEKYYGDATSESQIHVFSVTKSVISILIGIAIDQGYLKSVEQNVFDFFPNDPRRSDASAEITIKHLLTMTAPYRYKFAPYKKYFTSNDWVKSALDLLDIESHTKKFRYTPLIGPDILSGILVRATGISVREFAQENLFKPLGISVAENIAFQSKQAQLDFMNTKFTQGWVIDPGGTNTAGWGLSLSTADMAKIGLLYLNQGIWNGQRIVSAEWIAESTKEHSRWRMRNLPYGYLWWLGEDGGYAAMGDGGNVIYVSPQKQLVVAITSFFAKHPKDRIRLIKEQIEPLF